MCFIASILKFAHLGALMCYVHEVCGTAVPLPVSSRRALEVLAEPPWAPRFSNLEGRGTVG